MSPWSEPDPRLDRRRAEHGPLRGVVIRMADGVCLASDKIVCDLRT